MQTCIWPSGCHCHSLSLASVKSRLVLPFCYRLTWVVPEKGPSWNVQLYGTAMKIFVASSVKELFESVDNHTTGSAKKPV